MAGSTSLNPGSLLRTALVAAGAIGVEPDLLPCQFSCLKMERADFSRFPGLDRCDRLLKAGRLRLATTRRTTINGQTLVRLCRITRTASAQSWSVPDACWRKCRVACVAAWHEVMRRLVCGQRRIDRSVAPADC